MAGNWTDPNLKPFIRKKIYPTEFMTAYEERVRFWRTDTHPYFDEEDAPLPTFYYDYGATPSKEWGDDYPDPSKGPHGLNNKVRNDHVGGARKLIVTTIDGVTDYHYLIYPTGDVIGDFYLWFADDAINYREYLCETTALQARRDFLTKALGQNNWTEDSGILTPNVVSVKADHIRDIRKCFNNMCYVGVAHKKYEVRTKSGGDSGTSYSNAWEKALDAWEWASWSSWSEVDAIYNPPYVVAIMDRRSGNNASMFARQVRMTYDLDRDPGGDWSVFPPLEAMFILNRPYAGAVDYEYRAGFWGRVNSTKKSLGERSGDIRTDVVDDDLVSVCGSGHSSEEFIISSQNEFSRDDMDLLKPADPGSGNIQYLHTTLSYVGYESFGNTGRPYGFYAPGWIVIRPDWNYGAP